MQRNRDDRLGKTKDIFKKIKDTKGTFHAKMGSKKDRNGMDLTEAEDIKKSWQEYYLGQAFSSSWSSLLKTLYPGIEFTFPMTLRGLRVTLGKGRMGKWGGDSSWSWLGLLPTTSQQTGPSP